MRTWGRSVTVFAAILFAAASGFAVFGQGEESKPVDIGILVVSSTPDYRHESIPAGNRALKRIGQQIEQRPGVRDVRVDIVDSEGKYRKTKPRQFPSNASVLKNRYDVLVFNNSNDSNPPDSEEILLLNDQQQQAFRAFIKSGGGFVGIHSAVDNMTEDSFYSRVLGAYFDDHANFQKGTVKVPDRVHPSTKRLPVEWEVESEWYTFRENPRGDVHVLAAADESSYDGPGMNGEGHLHPVSWCQKIAGGRSFYTALGHDSKHFKNKNILNHLLGGVTWAAGLEQGQATGTVWGSYQKTPLDQNTSSPVSLDVAPDGRVFYVDREDYDNDQTDYVRVINPDGSGTETVLELPVSSERIYGLKDLLLDPDFESNGWVYLFYVAPEDVTEKEGSIARLSRFTVSDGTISRSSEQEFLSFYVDSQMTGHLGGNLDWGPEERILYISVGDDTDIATGYTPIDERDGQAVFDAQRTSANSADLRGSILRIIPKDDGSYRIPKGNLFTPRNGFASQLKQGTVRPEIFVMGVRNPYRIAVDPETGVLYWGDYGPDAGNWDPKRGPLGMVEFNRATEPGFFGWPFLVGNNIPYRDYDFATKQSGELFSPSGPVNDSPYNSGLKNLPAGTETMITYTKSWEEYLNYPSAWKQFVPYRTMDDVPFPQMKGGAPMQGPVYRFQSKFGTSALPSYYEGKVFIMDRGRNWIKYVTLNEDGEPVTVEPFLPNHSFKRPMDLEVGPDGALYLIEWGSGWNAPNDDSGIYRITQRKTVTLEINGPASGSSSLMSGGSYDLDTTITNRTTTPIRLSGLDLKSPDSSLQIHSEQLASKQLLPGQSTSVTWTLSVPESVGDTEVTLGAELRFTTGGSGESKSVRQSRTIPVRQGLSVPFGVNTGGNHSVNAEGITFYPTPHSKVTSKNTRTSGLDETGVDSELGALYKTLHFGEDLGYDIPLDNGRYDVSLYFLECYFKEPGKRVFSMFVEGNPVVERLDLYREVGYGKGLKRTVRNVQVTDGQLSITTRAHENLPVLSGFAIRPAKQQAAGAGEMDQEARNVNKTVKITAGDNLMYDVEEFAVRPGATVKLTFEHTGQLSVKAMGHNVVILTDPSLKPVSFARRASRDSSVKNDYLSDAVRNDVLAATELIGGGESDTIVFTAPDTPGKYPYVCTFPQHAASMNGKMVVED